MSAHSHDIDVVDDFDAEPLSYAVSTNGAGSVLVRVSAGDSRGVRPGVDIACVIDVSGSMNDDATYEQDDGAVLTDGLSILDLAKHALRVIVASLTPRDRLCLVAFSGKASVKLPLTWLTADGVAAASAAIDQLQAAGSTNIWAGVRAAFELLRGVSPAADEDNSPWRAGKKQCKFFGTPRGCSFGERCHFLHAAVPPPSSSSSSSSSLSDTYSGRRQTVFLLTDGQPNISPKTGEVSAARDYLRQHAGQLDCQLATFGFGYGLDSALLQQLATVGNSCYVFIPTAPVLGTAFAHALANALNTHTPSLQLTLRACNGASFAAAPDQLPGGIAVLSRTTATSALTVAVGPVQFGQCRDVVVPMTLPSNDNDNDNDDEDPPYLHVLCNDVQVAVGASRQYDADADIAAVRAACVDMCLAELAACVDNFRTPQHGLQRALAAIDKCDFKTDERLVGLRRDIEGRVTKSFDGVARFRRWGMHYVRALCRAHVVQQCTNPLDAGLQVYGGALFQTLRSRAAALFLELPPPVRSKAPRVITPAPHRAPVAAAAKSAATASSPLSDTGPGTPSSCMAQYTTDFGGCFAGDCTVVVDGVGPTLVRHVRRGQRLLVAGDRTARVLCVVRSAAPPRRPLVAIAGGPTLTRSHPVLVDGRWQRPRDLATAVARPAAQPVYNFLLDDVHVLLVDGVACATLAHGLHHPSVAHPFYGTDAVVHCLRRLPGWPRGLVTVSHVRRAADGRVVALLAASEN